METVQHYINFIYYFKFYISKILPTDLKFLLIKNQKKKDDFLLVYNAFNETNITLPDNWNVANHLCTNVIN